eukprot:jgi/Undpi1/4792/HiC_scaffold_19.g08145.m1
MEADRKIPAVKLFVSQLDNARQPVETTDNVVGIDNTNLLVELSLQGVGFTRVWLQGIVVKVDRPKATFMVDDGTGTIAAVMPHADGDASSHRAQSGRDGAGDADDLPDIGRHVLLVGAVEAPLDGQQERCSCRRYRLLCDVIKDVGREGPNRDTLWGLEVVDFWSRR